ncbi:MULTISPECIES: hypothetical protein [unclassified Hydrogenophaga]|jgi:predicted RNA methylase|uniref:hypothetical protein n=1 Tax=Burkholderiales TaxID=80840 RepID=UPI00132042E8|nr:MULTISPECIES: hypothetical protein [unclassified Hydrogenophaga]MDP3351410.1 hypothetical protein [Hydrogenophaga sp.]QHE78827.1 hypothetical protein F9Z45_22145 [Hydrogenophaga sp. PBL-H3]QHE83252.1 hypothetical protein F9Z44_22145 [Hydrogenophaga sp. PBL-H3]
MKFIPTTPADVEKLKARAKVLKRRHNIKHREALERASREAGYAHWHHVSICQAESERAVMGASLAFLCSSIQKDAIKGETHYIGDPWPLRFVVFANGSKDAALLDITARQALILVEGGQEREFSINEDGPLPVIAWHGRFEVESDVVVITQDPTGASVRMSVDPAALLDAIDRSSAREGDDEDDGLFVHDMDEPASGELLEMVLNGTGLVPITAEIAQSLVDSGYTSEQVAEATAAGAQYSPSRHSIFYPPESSF